MDTDPLNERLRKKAECCLDIVQSLLPDMTNRARHDLARILMDSQESKLRVVQQALRNPQAPVNQEPDVPQAPVTHDTKLPWE